jgi:type IV pilus assembly protein PilM
MGLTSRNQKPLIGIDLGSSRLKMAQLAQGPSGLELIAAAAADVPPQAWRDAASRLSFQGRQIRSLLKSCPFAGRRGILSLPASSVFLQPIRIPMVQAREVDGAIRVELDGKLPFPVQEAVIRHVLAGTVYGEGEKLEVIVVAARRSELQQYLDMAGQSGLDVAGIDVEACAVVECFARFFRRISDTNRLTLFIDIGSSSTQVVLSQGHKMIFARNLPLGGTTLDAEVASLLKISLQQAQVVRMKVLSEDAPQDAAKDLFRLLDAKIAEMSQEIIHCLRYCEASFRNEGIERVIFVGGQAHNKRLCQCIAEKLNLPAQVGDPMAGVKRNEQQVLPALCGRGPQPAWAVAVGLSLGASMVA